MTHDIFEMLAGIDLHHKYIPALVCFSYALKLNNFRELFSDCINQLYHLIIK